MSKNVHHNSPSTNSESSLASVGLDDHVVPAQPASAKDELPRPLPVGALATNEPVYDCIAYVIYCPTHETIAVSNVTKSKCVWLPFVPMTEKETWIKASHDGVDLLIGRDDPEMEAEEAERQAPVYRMNHLHLLRLQLPSRSIIHRLSQFVYLEPNPHFKCCRNTERVNWLAINDIHQNKFSQIWGPEIKILLNMLASHPSQVVNEFSCRNALYYLNLRGSRQQELLAAANLTANHVYEIYSDYVEHCFPAFYMCPESLRVYFLKLGLAFSAPVLSRIFNAFRMDDEKRSFIDFHEFIVGLVAFEPNCSNRLETRIRFIFKYYDNQKKGHLDDSDVYSLLKDAFPSMLEQKVHDEVRLYMANRRVLSYEDFLGAFHSKLNSQLFNLCRAPRSLLAQISSLLSSKNKERQRLNQACQGVLRAKRVTKGTCWSCRAQQYEYGNQSVTIDTVGRCVEPAMIQVMPPPSSQFSVNRARYSLECVFSISSIPNIFIDLVRDFNSKRCSLTNQFSERMTLPLEWNVLHKYLRILCNELVAMLSVEEKFIKISGPAFVVGDLRGNLSDLMSLERLFWQSFPVIPENLVFLGNYSGKFGFGIECIIYLCALKLLSPNKVFMLRGASELGVATASDLLQECTRKFGSEHGKTIFGLFLQIFAKLPIAVLIDENILATHSGIPLHPRLNPLMKLPKDMPALLRDSPMAYEIITRFPRGYTTSTKPSSAASSGSRKSTKSRSRTNANKVLFGGQVGDSQFHFDFKSSSLKKADQQKATKPKSIKSSQKKSQGAHSKGTPITQKSGKSIFKSLRTSSNNSRKSIKSLKSNKSLKSIKSPKSLRIKSSLLPKPKSTDSMRTNKSGASLGSSKSGITSLKSKLKSVGYLQFSLPKVYKAKLRPTFLQSSKKSRKSTRHKSPLKSGKSPKANKHSISIRLNHESFDRREFLDFIKANDISFLIRSGSACKLGFKIRFSQQCLTVFSCSNVENHNEAAVAAIDGTSYSVRFLRFTTARASASKPPPPTTVR